MMSFLQSLSVPYTLLLSIAIATLLVYLPFLVVAYGRLRTGYNMSAPRAMFDKLPPYAQRATWAHQNSFESFALFAIAALMAYVTGQNTVYAVIAALVYLVARLFYSVAYIFDVPVLRSLMFVVGSLCIATLIGLSVLFGAA